MQGPADAEDFLKDFYSPYTGVLWGEDYKENFMKILPDEISGTLRVWNPGCGQGFETYAIASVLKLKYPKASIRIWANDVDLLKVSTAPNLILKNDEIPEYMLEAGFLKQTNKGYAFIEDIKDNIIFEYHDILHRTEYPDLNIIVARDLLSFFETAKQMSLLEEFRESLQENGLLVIGENEALSGDDWYLLEEGNVKLYKLETT